MSNQSISDLVSVRSVTLDDLPFILDSSIACLSRYTESFVKGYETKYTREYLELIMQFVLNDEKYSIFICSHKDDSNNIIGYLIANPLNNHIFMQYTKYAYRKLGVQKHMLLPLLIDITEEVTVQWPTKEMLKLQKKRVIIIKNRLVEELIQLAVKERHENS